MRIEDRGWRIATALILLSVLGGGCATTTRNYAKPDVKWAAAYEKNFRPWAEKQPRKVHYIIIHTVEGTYEGCVSWFQNPKSKVSAHYVVSRAGEVTQMVKDEDIAFQAGNWRMNTESIGIEHEGYAHRENGWTLAQVRASAALTRWLCLRYGVPMDKQHIIGHVEVPPPSTHTDPGEFFDWDYYLWLVRGGGHLDPRAPGVANPPPWRKIEWPRERSREKRGLREGVE